MADKTRNNEGDADEDDLEKFSDINSQEDDARTRERKEKQSLRKSIKGLGLNLMNKANSLIVTPVSALTALGRTIITPFDASPSYDTRDEKKVGGGKKEDGDEKMSEDEKRRIMRMIEDEDSSEDKEESDEDDKDSTG